MTHQKSSRTRPLYFVAHTDLNPPLKVSKITYVLLKKTGLTTSET